MTRHATHPHGSPAPTSLQTQHPDSCGEGHPYSPTHEQIAYQAYDIYVKTGRKSGQCKQNWQQAEEALRDSGQTQRHSNPSGSTAEAR